MDFLFHEFEAENDIMLLAHTLNICHPFEVGIIIEIHDISLINNYHTPIYRIIVLMTVLTW